MKAKLTEGLVPVGHFGRPVGLRGELRLVLLGEALNELSLPLSLFVECNGEKSPIVLEEITGSGVLKCRIRGVGDRDAADILKSGVLLIEEERLPHPGEDSLYFYQLLGMNVITSDGDPYGKVVEVYKFPTTDAIEVRRSTGENVMVPYRREVVIAVDCNTKTITVDHAFLADM